MSLSKLDRVLTNNGYAIKKSSLTSETSQKLKKDLTVTPLIQGKPSGQSFIVYTESPQRFYVPRQWGIINFGEAEAIAISDGEPLSANAKIFTGKPYPYQETVINMFIDSKLNGLNSNGLICVPCGRGKTFMALAIASKLGRRFLIIVDKEFLMNQWMGEINSIFPNLRVGILQSDRCEIDPLKWDVTICMIQTLVQREFPQNTFSTYGFTIFDECHHLGASQFSRSLMKIQTKYMLGLSATPTRDDGLTKVFEWYIGKPVYLEQIREPDPTVIVHAEEFSSDNLKYNEVPTDYKGEMILARLLTNVVECKERNQRIADILIKVALKEPKRRILVLSERISHLESIEALIVDSKITMSYYIGGMKEVVRESGAQTARIILGTYAMASEAMNIKTLNTILLASPRKKVEQSTGRIFRLRKEHREVEPLIIDIIDSHGVYKGQWRKRATYYRKCEYKIEKHGKDDVISETELISTDCLINDD